MRYKYSVYEISVTVNEATFVGKTSIFQELQRIDILEHSCLGHGCLRRCREAMIQAENIPPSAHPLHVKQPRNPMTSITIQYASGMFS
jgi:hypothetical protein